MNQDKDKISALTDEIETLRLENHHLTMKHKKLTRLFNLAEKRIERNKNAAQAKDSLANMISARRSELERYMNLLLDNCPDMILLFDSDGKLAYCTESFLKICSIAGFGLIKGTPVSKLLAPYTEERLLDAMNLMIAKIYKEKKTFEFSDTIDFNRSKKPRSYSIQVTPMLTENGKAEGFMLLFSDTTEIIKAQKDAEQANAAKSDFLATISHEIRTPMNAIIGIAEILKGTGLTPHQQGYLKSIQDSSHVLLNLINDILDFSKIEADKLEIVEEYFRLDDLLKNLQSMFELMFQQKNIDFICTFSADLPKVVFGDDKRIRQILTNVLNNALKYTHEGIVRFLVQKDDGGKICFAVEDTGIGIKQDAIPRLFSAFERFDLARNKGVIGTGLGLAITRKLCTIMNGSVDVKSEYTKGSIFTVRLPLAEGSPEDLPIEQRKDTVFFKAPKAKALVVDDIEINLQITAYMLESFEIQPDLAQSGKQAVEKAAANHYDIIFMDHMMPEMDGIEAAGIIRSMGSPTKDIPIVALSANAVSDAVEKFFVSGFNDFLSKPMEQAALAQCLVKWLPMEKIIHS